MQRSSLCTRSCVQSYLTFKQGEYFFQLMRGPCAFNAMTLTAVAVMMTATLYGVLTCA